MSGPKFAVGERAILRLSDKPTQTVEITALKYSEFWFTVGGNDNWIGWGYRVSPGPGPDKHGGLLTYQKEINLHKTPPVADQSFDQIMQELKSPVPEGNETA